jgi:hypothetical protein
MRYLPSSIFIFIFFNEPISLAHHSKKMKLQWFLHKKILFWGKEFLPFGPSYRQKQDNICQSIWDKSEVLLGSLWGSMPGTWELFALTPQPHPKKKKKSDARESPLSSGKWTVRSPPNTTWENHPPPVPPKNKKGRALHSMRWLLIGCMETQFLKLAATIFGLPMVSLITIAVLFFLLL